MRKKKVNRALRLLSGTNVSIFKRANGVKESKGNVSIALTGVRQFHVSKWKSTHAALHVVFAYISFSVLLTV